MRLRRQLLLVSLVVLVLPWAGYEYLQRTAEILRAGEAAVQAARAEAVAAYLASTPEMLLPLLPRSNMPRLFVPDADQPLLIDGDLGDWPKKLAGTYPLFNDQLQVRLLRLAQTLYIGMRVEVPAANMEALAVRLKLAQDTWSLQLNDDNSVTAAAGNSVSPYLRGSWLQMQELGSLEFALPLSLVGEQLGFEITLNGRTERLGLDAQDTPASLVYEQPRLSALLAVFTVPGSKLGLIAQDGWLVAQSGELPVTPVSNRPLWMQLIQRVFPLQQADIRGGRHRDEYFPLQEWNLVGGTPQVVTFRPVDIGGIRLGWVRLEALTPEFALLYYRSLGGLMLGSLAIFVLVGLGLLSYASWLSWRIGQISRLTRKLVDEQGQVADFEPSSVSDELGDLSRDYAAMTRRLRRYTDYLASLAGKLSHEVRTPLTIVHSSLENLALAADVKERQIYLARAQEGVDRLRNMLRQMSSASALEASIDRAERERMDAVQLLETMLQAYRHTFSSHSFDYRSGGQTEAVVTGSADLIAQMLDKLVENALSFSEPGSAIELSSECRDGSWLLQVSNKGPLLPEGAEEEIFASLVSLREGRQGEQVHLGLGLSIVQHIVQSHGGRVWAQNRSDGSGVTFSVSIPLTDD